MNNNLRTARLLEAHAALLDALFQHRTFIHVHLMTNDHGHTTLRTSSPWPAPGPLAAALYAIAQEYDLHFCPTVSGSGRVVVDWEPLPELAELWNS